MRIIVSVTAAALLAGCGGWYQMKDGVCISGACPTPAPTAAPVVAVQAPATAAPAPVRFESDGTRKGAQGPFPLATGKHLFRATHQGTRNFIVGLKPAAGGIPRGAFNEVGAGAWEWSHVVDAPGDYYLDVQFADGAWSITVD